MTNDEEEFRKFQESLKTMRGKLYVLDLNVPVEVQMEYYRYSENIRREGKTDAIDEQVNVLFSPLSSIEDRKYAMAFLATSGDVLAYRALESYNIHADEELREWSEMALLQSRIVMEADLLDEKNIYISTGLGGRENRIRFFAFFKSKSGEPFSDYQRKLVEKEFTFALNRHHGEIETFKLKENYFTLVFLIDIKEDIKDVMTQALTECNTYGDFISEAFVITNLKIYSEEEIQNELNTKE